MIELIKLIGIGLVLGITTVIPGISTGTIAVVCNVYDRLVTVISPNIRKLLAAWKFWLPLVIGVFAGIILFSKVITLLFTNYRIPSYWFFIGIIAGSIPQIYSRVRQPGSALPALPVTVCCILALGLMAVMAIVKPATETAPETVLTLQLFVILFAGGALATAAMIIPGISGSFLLLVLGLYQTIIQAVSVMNIPLIIPVVLGGCLGLFNGAAFVRFLLKKAPRETNGAVLGLVAGSIIVLYPGGLGSGFTLGLSLAAVFVGTAIGFIFGRQKS